MDLDGDGVLDSTELVEAAALLLLGGGVFHGGGGGAGAGGEDEGEQGVVVDLLDQADGLLELLLGLTGEADNDVGSQNQIGHDGLGVGHLLQVGLPVIVAVHGLQHTGRAGLEGQVQLLGDLGILCHGVEELLGSVSGMAGHEADEEIAGELGNRGQQIGKIEALAQILAVGVDVLAQQGDLTGAVFDELAALGQDVLHLAAALTAADVGDDAVGAEIVAAVHDGHPALQGVVTDLGNALGNGAGLVLNIELALLAAQDVPQDLGELPQVMGGEDTIDVGEAHLDAVGDLGFAGHAAAQEDLLAGMAALGVGQLTQGTEDTLLSVLTDGAGVHNDHIGAFGAGGHGVAALGQVAAELFGVSLVLLAAVGLDIGGGGGIGFVPVSGNFIAIGELGSQLLLGNHGSFGIHNCTSEWNTISI